MKLVGSAQAVVRKAVGASADSEGNVQPYALPVHKYSIHCCISYTPQNAYYYVYGINEHLNHQNPFASEI
ncbi:hypothetical protein ACFXTI_046527 [Malus domestica]